MESNGAFTFTMLFQPAEEGGYVVTCPALPGLVTEGDTLEEARRMAQDALHGYLESLRLDGVTIPADKTALDRTALSRLAQSNLIQTYTQPFSV